MEASSCSAFNAMPQSLNFTSSTQEGANWMAEWVRDMIHFLETHSRQKGKTGETLEARRLVSYNCLGMMIRV